MAAAVAVRRAGPAGGLGACRGRAVQVDPIKPTLNSPGTKRLKLKFDTMLSTFAFNFNLRRHMEALRRCALRAFHTLVPALATSEAVKNLVAFDEGETLLRSAKGLMRAVGPGRTGRFRNIDSRAER